MVTRAEATKGECSARGGREGGREQRKEGEKEGEEKGEKERKIGRQQQGGRRERSRVRSGH